MATTISRVLLRSAATAAVLLAGSGAISAATPPSRLAYSVSVAGLPVAAADLVLGEAGNHYDLQLDWRTTGLAELFAGAHGAVSASGRTGGGHGRVGPTIPERYRLSGTTGRLQLLVQLAMSAGHIRSVTTEPQTRPSPDLIPLGPEHRRGVVDPLSAVLAPASEGGDGLCDRTVPIFDGWSRYDVRLTPKTTRSSPPDGFTGPVVVCAARWVPIAGHRVHHNATRYMADNTDMEVAFARLDGHDLWLPIDVRVGTMIGTARATVETASVAAPTAPAHKRRRMRT